MYTRYLGDLSGGQMMKRRIREAYTRHSEKADDKTGVAGVEFYEFPLVSDRNAFKNRYRDTLDSLPLSAEEKEQVVLEANRAFRYNSNVFKEFESSSPVIPFGTEKTLEAQNAKAKKAMGAILGPDSKLGSESRHSQASFDIRLSLIVILLALAWALYYAFKVNSKGSGPAIVPSYTDSAVQTDDMGAGQ